MMEQGSDSDKVINENNKKRPFNKRKWREQKYSKRQKIEQWQERRKKAALHKYHKMLRKENNSGEAATYNKPKENSRHFKPSKYKEALMEYERKCKEREEKRQEAMRIKAEKEAAREQSRALRAERQRKLAKKTRKGQPVMKDRLEIMLEKIQKMQ